MKILVSLTLDQQKDWVEALNGADDSGREYIGDDGVSHYDEIHYVVAAQPHDKLYSRTPNLKAALSLWAGMEHLTSQPDFNVQVPVYRMIEPGLSIGMIEYVMGHVLHYHLAIPLFSEAQERSNWIFLATKLAKDRTVGVMGLGSLGTAVAEKLAAFGFKTLGWARSQHEIENVTCYSGKDQMTEFLSQSEILVLLLPHTRETQDILNQESMAHLPEGSAVINVGRGCLINEDDLLAGIKKNKPKYATLDVFNQEPLPKDHPFWANENITITPHLASQTRIDTGKVRVIEVLDSLAKSEGIEGRYDPDRDY